MTCGIYRITHRESGRHYVGQSVNIESRFNDHRKGQGSRKLAHALKRYGPDAFDFVIAIQCPRGELNLHEARLIEELGCLHPKGFNLIPGGYQPGAMSDETRRLFSEAGKRRMSDPKKRAALLEIVRKTHADPAWRARQSEFMKELMNSPEAKVRARERARQMNERRWGSA